MDFIATSPADAFETGELSDRILKRTCELNRKKNEVYDPVHRVLAHAAGRASLLPDTTKCGGAGKSRTPKKCARLGRVNAAYRRGEIPSPGIHLSAENKRHIAIGHSKFVGQGLSVREAYLLTMGAWWSTSTKLVGGVAVPVLQAAHERPSLSQFRYWGPRDPDGKSAFELLLKPDEWDLKFRAMLGASMDGLSGVGQMGVVDATGIHVTFVSATSFLNALGPGHRIVIHDGLSEVISGFYCGLEAPGENTAHLAVCNSAMDKVEFFARFGVTITSNQVPAVFYRKLRGDNGELRNLGMMQTLSALGCGLELVQRKRAERKPQAEAGHHVMQGLLDDKLDGATRGGPPDRGEDHSAIPACWTWFDYMAEFLRAIVYFNCHADATALMRRHPFRAEMQRDGVPARRAAIHAWCVKNNHVSIPAYDNELLRAKLLPHYRAVVKQSGIYLLRPDRGEKPEILWGPRYSGRRAMELRWHEGKRKDFHIDVRMDPNHPDRCWYIDELGIHSFENLSGDQTMKRECNLDDIIAMQDQEHIRKLAAQSETDQAASDFVSHRENVNLTNRAAKKAEIAAVGGKVTKTRLKSNMSQHRAREAALIADSLDPITRAPRLPKTRGETAPSASEQCSGSATPDGATIPQSDAKVPTPSVDDRAHQAGCSDASEATTSLVDASPSPEGALLKNVSPADSVVALSLAAFRLRRKSK